MLTLLNSNTLPRRLFQWTIVETTAHVETVMPAADRTNHFNDVAVYATLVAAGCMDNADLGHSPNYAILPREKPTTWAEVRTALEGKQYDAAAIQLAYNVIFGVATPTVPLVRCLLERLARNLNYGEVDAALLNPPATELQVNKRYLVDPRNARRRVLVQNIMAYDRVYASAADATADMFPVNIHQRRNAVGRQA